MLIRFIVSGIALAVAADQIAIAGQPDEAPVSRVEHDPDVSVDDRTDGVFVFPQMIRLSGASSSQRLLLQRRVGGHWSQDLTSDARWTTSDSSVVDVRAGVAWARGNGCATLTASTPFGDAVIGVEVESHEDPIQWEFKRHVLPVLSRAGCNMGSCHGALAGKGGFRLSLRGYHPEGDYQTMTREARGRRVELSDPGRSLILAKPSGALPHKGGLRLPVDSRGYQVIAAWIAQGAAPPDGADSELVALHVQPPNVRLNVGQDQQLLVSAQYADGRVEDVTEWAMYSSSDETIAQVDENGRVSVSGHGEGAIVVWFSSQLVLARIVSPYPYDIAPSPAERPEEANFIDRLVGAKLRQLNLEASPRCDDSTFLRRAFLDSIGRLPTIDEAQQFLHDSRLDKRQRLIDQLLSRDDYVDYWTYRWSDLLLVNGRRLRPVAVKAYYGWIRDHVAANTPWDTMVRQILTATGTSTENGAANFYSLHQDPESMTENVSQAFLGLSIGCAKCHNHPLEKWTNDEYYAMANFFSRVKAKGWGGDARSGDGIRTVFVASQGDLIQPLTGQPQWPTPLDGAPLPSDAVGDRREYLADWLVSPENPYFGRAIANRVWAAFFGKGLVNPIDDLRISNPARNEALLEALSQYLADADFDLKLLMRQIMLSETYQRSGRSLETNQGDDAYFSRYYARRLPAEVLLDAIAQATEVPSRFTQIGYDGSDFEATLEYPVGTRAVELQDSAVVSSFLTTFGRNERDITCECERSNTPSIVQVLHISNGTTINDRLKDEQSCVAKALAKKQPWELIIREAFLRTLSREPTSSERKAFAAEFANTDSAANDEVSQREQVEDLYWSLMSTREFLFNH